MNKLFWLYKIESNKSDTWWVGKQVSQAVKIERKKLWKKLRNCDKLTMTRGAFELRAEIIGFLLFCPTLPTLPTVFPQKWILWNL